MRDNTNWRDLVGKRALIKAGRLDVISSFSTGSEFTVVEVSPTGKRVKLRNANGEAFWWETSELQLVEVLGGKLRGRCG